ncbi:MAG: RNA-binding transcriptional accessory protein, partial [Desulfobulbaceae bacterium]|nr:RNA-binding transcriptional accessory protein [Desulfobulbaceae bacterium]
MDQFTEIIARELKLRSHQVTSTMALFENGATVPFIARYRKEATGMLDETQITAVRDRLAQLAELEKRRHAIIVSLTERALLNDGLNRKILSAANLTILEDIYLPYRPKRRTKGTIARERGLEPLAQAIFAQDNRSLQPAGFINPAKEVENENEALAGARDIIAEWISEKAATRAELRKLFAKEAVVTSCVVKKNEAGGSKFRDYFDWQEPVAKAPSHRLLAMLRGENEKMLTLSLRPPEERALAILQRFYVKAKNEAGRQVAQAVEDSYKRLLGPSLENELRNNLKDEADQEAIRVFANNLRELLLAPPMGQKRVMALD